jgi:hypothetical protein
MAVVTATPVGQPFQMIRPASVRSRTSRRSLNLRSEASAWIVAVSEPPTTSSAVMRSRSPIHSTTRAAGPKHSSTNEGP